MVKPKTRMENQAGGTAVPDPADQSQQTPVQPSPLPHNLWGLLGQVIRVTGEQALPLLIAAGIVFAAYMFWNLQIKRDEAVSKARNEAQKQYKDEIAREKQSLVDARTQIAELSLRQMDSVKKLLDLQDSATVALEKQRKQTEDARNRADGEIERVRKAGIDLEEIRRKAQEAIDEKKLLSNELYQRERELKTNEKQFEKKSAVLAKRIGEISELTEGYTSLMKQVLALEDSRITLAQLRTTEAYHNALKFYEVYFPGNIEGRITNCLRNFASEPGESTHEKLQMLIGTSQPDLEPLLKDDLGFYAWIKVAVKSGSDGFGKSQSYFLGFKALSDYTCLLVGIAFADVEGEDDKVVKRVENVYSSNLAFVHVPTVRDWNIRQAYVFSWELDDKNDMGVVALVQMKASRTWSIEDFLKAGMIDDELAEVSSEFLYGKDREFQFLPYALLKEQYPQIYRNAMKDEFEQFADSADMLERSADFKSSIAKSKLLEPLPDELRMTFSQLILACVDRQVEVDARLLGSTVDVGVAGLIAARVLKKAFKIIRFEPHFSQYMRQLGEIQVQQRQMPAEGEPKQIVVEYDVFAVYQKSVFDKSTEAVLFRFKRASTDYGWVLTAFEDIRDQRR